MLSKLELNIIKAIDGIKFSRHGNTYSLLFQPCLDNQLQVIKNDDECGYLELKELVGMYYEVGEDIEEFIEGTQFVIDTQLEF